MVRNVIKNKKGISFIEIMVSMVILSIVVLFITNTLVTSSKRNSRTVTNSAGYAIAKELLSILRDDPRVSPDTTITRGGVTYKQEWEFDNTSSPTIITATVKWKEGGEQQLSEAVGYMRLTICPETSVNAPTDISIKDYDDNPINSVDRTILIEKGDGKLVATFEVADADLPNDIITVELISQTDKFRLSRFGDSLYMIGELPTDKYNINIKATDCKNKSIDVVFDVEVFDEGALAKPVIDAAVFSKVENETEPADIGALSSNSSIETWTLQNYEDLFEIDATSGMLSLQENKFLNFEHQSIYEVSIKGTTAGLRSGYGTLTINVRDTNDQFEIWVDTSSTTTPQLTQIIEVEEGTANGTFLGKMVVVDEDAANVLAISNKDILAWTENDLYTQNSNSNNVILLESLLFKNNIWTPAGDYIEHFVVDSFNLEKALTGYPLTIRVTENISPNPTNIITTKTDGSPIAIASLTIVEGETFVCNIDTEDPQGNSVDFGDHLFSYQVLGTDASLFEISAGQLKFRNAPTYDGGNISNNRKIISIKVTDAQGNSYTQNGFNIKIEDDGIAPVLFPTWVSGTTYSNLKVVMYNGFAYIRCDWVSTTATPSSAANWRKEKTWSSSVSYVNKDLVEHNGSYYYFNSWNPSTGKTPGVNSEWVVRQ